MKGLPNVVDIQSHPEASYKRLYDALKNQDGSLSKENQAIIEYKFNYALGNKDNSYNRLTINPDNPEKFPGVK